MLFALTFILAKAAMHYVSPFFFIGTRMVIAGSMLLGYSFIQNKKIVWPKRSDYYLFVQLALFHIFLAYTLEFWALQYVSSGKAALIFNASPFITAVLMQRLFSDQLSWRQWTGLFIGFIGFLPLLVPYILQESLVGAIGFLSYPEIALIGSVVSSSYGWIVFKRLMIQKSYSPLLLNGIGMSLGGLLALAVSAVAERGLFLNSAHSVSTALYHGGLYMAALILIANFICYNLYGYLLQSYSATFLSFAGFTTPLFAALFGYVFLQEPVSNHFVIAVLIILLGLYLFYQDELSDKKINKKAEL